MSRPGEFRLAEEMAKTDWLWALLAIAVLLLGGCAVGPNYRTPVVETPSAYKEAENWKPAQPNDQNLGGDWWTIFQDPQLDAARGPGQCIESESESR